MIGTIALIALCALISAGTFAVFHGDTVVFLALLVVVLLAGVVAIPQALAVQDHLQRILNNALITAGSCEQAIISVADTCSARR